jgi:hypothetical protein
MTNAIIDNSTLTAVQRVLGHIPGEQGYDLSGDLSAFDNYLSAMLLVLMITSPNILSVARRSLQKLVRLS